MVVVMVVLGVRLAAVTAVVADTAEVVGPEGLVGWRCVVEVAAEVIGAGSPAVAAGEDVLDAFIGGEL